MQSNGSVIWNNCMLKFVDLVIETWSDLLVAWLVRCLWLTKCLLLFFISCNICMELSSDCMWLLQLILISLILKLVHKNLARWYLLNSLIKSFFRSGFFRTLNNFSPINSETLCLLVFVKWTCIYNSLGSSVFRF